MKKQIYTCVAALSVIGFANAQQEVAIEKVTKIEAKEVKKKEQQAKVQIAIILDSSTSMNGLINQARAQLWDVVNTFIDAKVDGKVPFVEVALYTHGQGPSGDLGDFTRKIQPLTRDLDQISKELFALHTTGGTEYCGAVVTRATKELEWDPNPKTYKAIFIAGNESFKQGDVDAEVACKAAIAKGIIVNTIYCGSEAEGISGGWKACAMLADGTYTVINQHRAIAHVEAPQDAKILELNKKLNKTYVTYNDIGRDKVKLQKEADVQNAALSSNTAVNRACSKASGNYWNSSWDLVDASSVKDFDWSTIKDERLPAELKKLNIDERKKWVAEKRQERKKVQDEITKLASDRQKFVSNKQKELAEKDGVALDSAIRSTVITQAKKKGYVFEKK